MPDRIVVKCSGCQKRLAVPATAAGKRIRCPSCGDVVSVAHDAPEHGTPTENPATTAEAKPVRTVRVQRSSAKQTSPQEPGRRTRKTSRSQRTSRDSQEQKPRRRRQQKPEPVYDDFDDFDDDMDDGSWNDAYEEAAPLPATALPARRKKKKKKKEASKPIAYGTGHEPPSEYKRQATYSSFGDRLTNGGVLGGVGMMVGAAIWFFLGLSVGIIYFYPPILFVMGLIAVINGLFGD